MCVHIFIYTQTFNSISRDTIISLVMQFQNKAVHFRIEWAEQVSGRTGWPVGRQGQDLDAYSTIFFQDVMFTVLLNGKKISEFIKVLAPLSSVLLPATGHTCIHMHAWARECASSLKLTQYCDFVLHQQNAHWDHIKKILITCCLLI